RCQQEGEPIDAMPHVGALGEEIKSKICASCWKAWNEEAVRIINEHRLKLSLPSARDFLSTQMKIFLKFMPPPETQSDAISVSAPI
ncbi:MAG: Fe(2+)-trafficking protein, partial [Nitrospirota bacterium]